ncbi:MAG TPA: heterodisulfide reductase-related iron-sulfur binding cluster, partial [Candidatus Bathyarchaeia archaeon]|nr:heterodisulfide reductase-related iron-sulfur binding cluster [Candidatus Bathyarchaeia archaeon]
FVCGIIMLIGIYRNLRSYGLGLTDVSSLISKDLVIKLRRFTKYGLGQRKVLQGGSGGVMHGALFYGFLMLFAYTSLIFIQTDILPLFTNIVFMQGDFYLTLEFLGDTLGVAFVVGLIIAVYRRFVQRLEKLETQWDDYFVLTMLIWIGVSGFLLEAMRFLATQPSWAIYSPVGYVISQLIGISSISESQARIFYQVLWWAHMFSVMVLIAIWPYTKLVHVLTSSLNIAVSPMKQMGALSTPFSLAKLLETGEFQTPPNVTSSMSFKPTQRLSLDACTNCGRCQEVCPAYASGRDLSPRLVVQDLGADMRGGEKSDVFSSGVIREQELWSCTACNACVDVCPVFINPLDFIIEFRRTLVADGKLDGLKRAFLENIARSNNPYGLPQNERQNWLQELGVPTVQENPTAEYLYWIGCQGSYDPRARKITKSVIKILKTANVNFAILGNEEACTGESVRRLGEEARFQELVMKNLETIRASGVKKIIVHCAHCFNTFLNEYPEFGAEFTVIHHSQLINELIKEGKLKPGELRSKVTFHDPCNLGRINSVFEDPRQVLQSTKGLELIEMKRSRADSFCCGGGGANVWYQVPEKKKIGVIRVEEAIETGAETLAVACPFCITMFEDGAKALGNDKLTVKDIAEIIAETLPDN